MPLNAHLAVKGRDGIARESALVTEVFNYIDHMYYTGVFTGKQADGFTKRLMNVKTVAGLTKLAKDAKAMEDAVLHPNPRRTTARRRAPARRTPDSGAGYLVSVRDNVSGIYGPDFYRYKYVAGTYKSLGCAECKAEEELARYTDGEPDEDDKYRVDIYTVDAQGNITNEDNPTAIFTHDGVTRANGRRAPARRSTRRR